MTHALAVALGGAAGALLRYGAVLAANAVLGVAFPYGTLLVNALGSGLAGLGYPLLLERLAVAEEVRLALLVGLLGAFTTFSTFSMETLRLYEAGAWGRALTNVGLNVGVCLAAAALGLGLARRLGW